CKVAPAVGVRVPECVAAVIDRDAQQAVIVMRDLIADGARFCSALEDFSADDAIGSLGQLARLHAAARCRRVIVRGAGGARLFVRGPDETPEQLLGRLRAGQADQVLAPPGAPGLADAVTVALGTAPALALLHQGDLGLPEDSAVYALFRRRLVPTLAAADLLT
ncbi:MAG TPA: hypothetical protein PKU97_11065, partial [Kofleriaceae bacterium]|nr:hypothetical protein [Kofleriaceae bacterium]